MGKLTRSPHIMTAAAHELVQRCIVRIETDGGQEKNGRHLGTGFFIAPQRVVSSAHVVAPTISNRQPLYIRWNGVRYDVTSWRLGPAEPLDHFDVYPWPDVAILSIAARNAESEDTLKNHPCVPVSRKPPTPTEPLWAVGYTNQYRKDTVQVIPVVLTNEGTVVLDAKWDSINATTTATEPVYKLAFGQVVPGMSGSPVLHLATGGICGLLKRSRATQNDAGGYAIPIEAALRVDTTIEQSNTDYWQRTHRPVLEARARGGQLFDVAVRMVSSHAAAALVELDGLSELEDLPIPIPARPSGIDDQTWLVTVFFHMDFMHFVQALQQISSLESKVIRLLNLVGACIPVRPDQSQSCWVGAVAASQLSDEFHTDDPRIVHVPADEIYTLERFREQYAAGGVGTILDASGVSSGDPQDKTASEQRILAAISRQLNIDDPSQWSTESEDWKRLTEYFRGLRTFVRLPASLDAYDCELLKKLRTRFRGMPLVIGAGGTVPDAVAISKDYFPLDRPNDPDLEKFVVTMYKMARGQLGSFPSL